MAFLRIQTGPRSGTGIHLRERSLTIGRGEKASLRLNDEGASRRHAEIFQAGELYFIKDLDSRNGTYVNERRISEVVLRGGDQIRIGETVVLFQEREDSPQSRVLRIENGSGTIESIKLRDTMVGVHTPFKPDERKVGRGGLGRRVAEIIASETNPQLVFEQVVREVGQAFQGDRADILWIDSVEPELRIKPLASFDTKNEGVIAVSRSILMEAIERREAIICSDAACDQRFGEARSIVMHSIRSVLCVPMVVEGAAAGVLYIGNSQRSEAFDKDDLDLAVQVGLQLSAVIGMLKLYSSRDALLRNALLLAVRAAQPASGLNRSLSVASYCQAIAQAYGLPAEQVTSAWVAGAIHQMEASADGTSRAGFLQKMAAEIPGLEPILDAVECQDERHDGSGSPRGRLAEEIPLLGRILSLAKEVERLTRAGGPEGKGMDLDQALALLRETAGEKFQADIVQACLVAHRSGALNGNGSPL